MRSETNGIGLHEGVCIHPNVRVSLLRTIVGGSGPVADKNKF